MADSNLAGGIVTSIDIDRLEDVASRLDLRSPNREALESLAYELAQHYEVDGKEPPFECVVDSATGVGKTYIMIAAIEYLAALGNRNFVIMTPGSTIRDKTIAHFTQGDPKSLLGNMESHPTLVTVDNFDTPATRAAIDDDSKVKVYVFTVQSLTAPANVERKKTHTFKEGLGAGFYQYLAELGDLVVFADEHHCYFGPAFSAAINKLEPFAIVGLTATPDPKTPIEQIIYRYPLAAAIADKLVKTPVIVARRDDLHDSVTKLKDGVALLDYKAAAIDAYCLEASSTRVNPVMLVIAQNTDEADEYAGILRSADFQGGRWSNKILVVHSNMSGVKKEKALADLTAVEDPDSDVRIIISVGMLKEGWDVKNVYVIASMRALVSKVLTEQTLGRGLRLPFGEHTGIELLDTLEVLAHEKYETLLAKAGALNEQFIDKRTRAILRRDAAGQTVAVTTTQPVAAPVFAASLANASSPATPMITARASAAGTIRTQPTPAANTGVGITMISLDERQEVMARQADDTGVAVPYEPLPGMPAIEVPVLSMSRVETHFKLADITDLEPFRKLGRKIATDPETELRRVLVSARTVTGPDGLRRTELVTTSTADRLEASNALYPMVEVRKRLLDALLDCAVVPKRRDQAPPANQIIDTFLEGVGPDAERILSAYGDRAAARLVKLVTDEHRKYLSAPRYEEVVDLVQLGRARESKRRVDYNKTGPFSKAVAYDSFSRSLYGVDWFDSSPERKVANIVDDSDTVACWVRLHTGELPILWNSEGREYNADLIVLETAGAHWIVEIKADDTIDSREVQAKRIAAKRWANYVNASDKVEANWRYLLVTETDIAQAQGSWTALKSLGD